MPPSASSPPKRPSLHQIPVESAAVEQGLEQLFSPQFLHDALSSRPSPYRERILTMEVVLFAVLHFLLHRLPSFLEVLRRLSVGAIAPVGAVQASPTAFYNRLRSLPHELFLDLLNDTTAALVRTKLWLSQGLPLVSFAFKVYAIDDTTLDALIRRTKALRDYAKGEMETLAGRLSAAVDLGTGLWAEVLYNPDSATNEKNHIRPLVQRLGSGALYLFDSGYVSFPFLDWMSERFCYFLTRLPGHVTFETIQELHQGTHYRDRIIWLGKYRADRAAYPVRLIELCIERTWYRFVTNMMDPHLLPAGQIWALYGKRWTIEKSFAALKRALGMAYLKMCAPNGVLIQIWSTLAVYQVVQVLRLEIAHHAGWQQDDVSWEILMRTLGTYPLRGPAPPLLDWLVEPARLRWLKKMGVRPRRRGVLPQALLLECQEPPSLPPTLALLPRASRQGCHHRPRTKPLDLLPAEMQASLRSKRC